MCVCVCVCVYCTYPPLTTLTYMYEYILLSPYTVGFQGECICRTYPFRTPFSFPCPPLLLQNVFTRTLTHTHARTHAHSHTFSNAEFHTPARRDTEIWNFSGALKFSPVLALPLLSAGWLKLVHESGSPHSCRALHFLLPLNFTQPLPLYGWYLRWDPVLIWLWQRGGENSRDIWVLRGAHMESAAGCMPTTIHAKTTSCIRAMGKLVRKSDLPFCRTRSLLSLLLSRCLIKWDTIWFTIPTFLSKILHEKFDCLGEVASR
jgi:hypothetical protein